MQRQGQVNIATLTQRPRFFTERHLLVAQQAKVCQDEFRPVLIQVAEEQQAKAITQRLQLQGNDRFGEAWQPVLQGPRRQFERLQLGEEFGLGRPRTRQLRRKTTGDFFLAQHLKQLLETQGAIVSDPAPRQQRLQGRQRRPDFFIGQLAGAKQLAFAHHHAHQQRPGSTRLLRELGNEGALAVVQQIGIAQRNPLQHLLEVVQVIERVVDRVGNHGKATGRH
ncbi:hypothetical protein D3C78_924260 [compost metagenome]